MLTAVLLVLAPAPADFSPLAFLVGHCWRGDFGKGTTDTHCFTATPDGNELRDHHEVIANGKRVYWGETIYRWDAKAKQVRYVYGGSDGGTSTGTARADGRDVDFGTDVHTAKSGEVTTTKTRWNRIGETAYEALAESSSNLGIPRRTRYERVD